MATIYFQNFNTFGLWSINLSTFNIDPNRDGHIPFETRNTVVLLLRLNNLIFNVVGFIPTQSISNRSVARFMRYICLVRVVGWAGLTCLALVMPWKRTRVRVDAVSPLSNEGGYGLSRITDLISVREWKIELIITGCLQMMMGSLDFKQDGATKWLLTRLIIFLLSSVLNMWIDRCWLSDIRGDGKTELQRTRDGSRGVSYFDYCHGGYLKFLNCV